MKRPLITFPTGFILTKPRPECMHSAGKVSKNKKSCLIKFLDKNVDCKLQCITLKNTLESKAILFEQVLL